MEYLAPAVRAMGRAPVDFSRSDLATEEAIVKRERMLQIFLVMLGVLFIALVYPLGVDLWQANWLVKMHNETEPMFLSFLQQVEKRDAVVRQPESIPEPF